MRKDLPVATHPAVLAASMSQHARGEVVHELDVGHQRAACIQTFEQVVRQHGVLTDAPFEGSREGIDIVKAFADETALGEQVLVSVRYGGAVGIHPGVS